MLRPRCISCCFYNILSSWPPQGLCPCCSLSRGILPSASCLACSLGPFREGLRGRQLQRWPPRLLTLRRVLCKALPLKGGPRLGHLLLTNRAQQEQRVLRLTRGYKRPVASVLLSSLFLSPSLAGSEGGQLPRQPSVERRTWRGDPTATGRDDPRLSVPVAHKALNPADHHVSELGGGSSPSQALG